MDLRQLRAVVAIAETGQFTRAAERLSIAQPSLSAQIRGLEAELGLALFDRTTRRVKLTDAGEELLVTARRVLAEIDGAAAQLQRRRGLLTGQVAIGITPTPGPFDLVALAASFHRAHPSIELAVREDLSAALAGQLREDRIELGILTITDAANLRGLTSQQLATEPLVAIVGFAHRLASAEAVPLDHFRDEDFVVSARSATIRETIIVAARTAGFEPRIAFESQNVARIRAIVAADLGVAFLPRSDATSPGPPVAILELAGAPLLHVISLVWRDGRHHSPAAQALLEHIRSEIPKRPQANPPVGAPFTLPAR